MLRFVKYVIFPGQFIDIIADNLLPSIPHHNNVNSNSNFSIYWFQGAEYNALKNEEKKKERLKILEKAIKNYKSITNISEKAWDKTPVL